MMAGKQIDVERFNGLMSNYQKALARIAALEAAQGTGGPAGAERAPEGRSRGAEGTSGSAGAGTGHSGTQTPLAPEMAANARRAAAAREALDQEDRALAERVAQVRTERAQAAALERYPAVAPILDMLSFNGDEAAYLEAAKELNAALGGADAAPPPPPEIPVSAGNVPVYPPDPYGPLDAAKAEARRTGSWSAYFRAREAIARGELPPSY